MMEIEEVKKKVVAWFGRLGRYKYVFLVIAAGILILLWPQGVEEQDVESAAANQSFSIEELEQKLERVLGQIDGVGQVSVALTIKTGTEYVFAQDSEIRDDSESTETVVISTGSGKQEVVVQTQIYPTFQGALIVCEGGADPGVKLLITQAVSALTGLSSGRITVCKGA